MDTRAAVSLVINGKVHTVSGGDVLMPLNQFIREHAGLAGTKHMCYEGGCGACVVSASFYDAAEERNRTAAVNSCLRPVYACDGWSIVTTEGIGNQRQGFHAIQERLADNGGSQCGYCSPGFVMNMHSLLCEKPEASEQDIENAFDGNLCRCTGYRPILQAMKSLSQQTDAPPLDIEDLTAKFERCKTTGRGCSDCHHKAETDSTLPVTINIRNRVIHVPKSLDALHKVLEDVSSRSVKFVCGDTAKGVFKREGPFDVFIDIQSVSELRQCQIEEGLVKLGSSSSLSSCVDYLSQASTIEGYEYCTEVVNLIKKVANTPVRNVGSWAGNLMMKKLHPEFVSDIYVMLETVGATLQVSCYEEGKTVDYSPREFVRDKSTNCLILSVTLPKLANTKVKFFKVMPRAQGSYAYICSGFCWPPSGSEARVVYGGISDDFDHASKTEEYLSSLATFGSMSQAELQGALQQLQSEIVPMEYKTMPSVEYRKHLAISLFYKFVLSISSPETIDARLISGGDELQRPLSSSKLVFDTNSTKWPLTKPMPKLTAKLQTSGEAVYVDSIPSMVTDTYAQFVLSTIASGSIASMDASRALAIPGVLAFITHKDIPSTGTNNFMKGFGEREEILSSGEVLYNGQPIGIVVADSAGLAIAASYMVTVTYKDLRTPILTLEEGIRQKSFFPRAPGVEDKVVGDAEAAIGQSSHRLQGSVSSGMQYHNYIENQSVYSIPEEEGMTVYAATTHLEGVQAAVANCLGFKLSDVHVKARRLGGAFGGKESRSMLVSSGAALAAHLVQRPVRMMMTLSANMKSLGWRERHHIDYDVGFDDEGKLNGLKIHAYIDLGCSPNDNSGFAFHSWLDNAYFCANWKIAYDCVRTNVPSTTFMRSPSIICAVFVIETIMEHIAHKLGRDPLEVKTHNFYKNGQMTLGNTTLTDFRLGSVMQQLDESAEIRTRMEQVEQFNKAHRWRKRGLSVVPLHYGVCYIKLLSYQVFLAVSGRDGSVVVTTGATEIGTGLDTRVIQVISCELDIPLDKVTFKGSDSITNSRAGPTGGSVPSEMCCWGVKECCDQIKARMAPIRAKMSNATWEEVVAECDERAVDLVAHYYATSTMDPGKEHRYYTYGATCTEVELDVLTGQSQINRADIVMDCGESINPTLDIGQVEGAFVMGLGYFLSEKAIFDPESGENLSASTWEYKIPTSKDIPIDFRIGLLRKSYNELGVTGSKAVGEPPITMSCSALFALKHAIMAARRDAGDNGYFQLDAPATVDVAFMKLQPEISQYTI